MKIVKKERMPTNEIFVSPSNQVMCKYLSTHAIKNSNTSNPFTVKSNQINIPAQNKIGCNLLCVASTIVVTAFNSNFVL
ncbi:MAG: hypothetical protein L3J74_01705, partial [Bacteroidales bacterium]|nr:hypothetical protein [Bacteroidales bacterium]